MLTTDVETKSGAAGNDTFNGTDKTLELDVLDGGAGTDTLNYVDSTGGVDLNSLGLTLTSIETINARSKAAATVSTDGFTGVANLNVTQGTSATVVAANTTAINVSGITGAVIVNGGSTVGVTSSTANAAVTIGANGTGAAPTGTVTVTHGKQGTGTIDIDGGTSVTVTASGVSTGTIDIGQDGTNPVPTGAIVVTSTGAAYDASWGGDVTLGAITIDGGTTVTVNQAASSDTSAAATDTSNKTVIQSDVTVNGTNSTTAVTVTQSAAVGVQNATLAVTGVKEQQEVTFGAMTTGQTLVINGLTFTASKNLTAEKVAAAFANLTAGSVQGYAPASDGIYSGTFSAALANGVNMTTGAASGTKVVFTEGTASTAAFNLGIGGSAAGTSAAAKTTGVTAVAGVTGRMGVTGGAVVIADKSDNANTITAVTLDGFGASSTFAGDGLTTLSLANSAQDLTVTNTVAATLGLTVNNLAAGAKLDDANGTYTTINVTTTGANSDLDLVATGVKALTVSGTKTLDLATGGSTNLAALETVTVTDSAGLNIGAESDVASLTSINTTGTTGTVTATIMGNKATYTGGAGVDNVSVSNSDTAISKAIDLGAGDDLLDLSADVTIVPTATLKGGEGTDTIRLQAGAAATLSGNTNFQDKIEGFERLGLTAVATGVQNVIDLDMMDDISYVISAGTADTAQVATIVLTEDDDGTTDGGAEDGSVMSVRVGGTTFSYTVAGGQKTLDQMGAALAGLINADARFTAAYNAGTDTISVTGTTGRAFVVDNFSFAADTADATEDYSAVITKTTASHLTLSNMANNGTLELTAAGLGAKVNMTDASGGTDTFNIITKVSTSDLNHGTVTVADVETINITATDTSTTAAINTSTLYLSANAAETVNITGNANLTLNLLGSSAVTLIDASSGFSGVLTAAAHNGGGTTIKGGSGNDVLTANGNQDKLYGGDGNDTLVVAGGNLVELYGGDGADIFDVSFAVSNINAYATIMDAAAGDKIKFSGGAANFKSTAITLGSTAVFDSFANEAIASSDTGDVVWFQFGGDTYVIENVSNNASVFEAGTDIIVKIAGQVDLSTASFSSSADTALVI